MWCVNGNLSILYFRISILTKEYKNYNVQPLDFFFILANMRVPLC